jgi:hypothetical protein
MTSFTIAGHAFELDHDRVERTADQVVPDPVREHYVVVRGRRYPPKQLLSLLTGLDKADFTTHQARRILKRLGFVAARLGRDLEPDEPMSPGSRLDQQAAALAPFVGKWVALSGPTTVLIAADTPQEILAWIAKHEQRAPYGMFRVPASTWEAEGLAPL